MTKREKYLEIINDGLFSPDYITEYLAVKRYGDSKNTYTVYYVDKVYNLRYQHFKSSCFFENGELFYILKENYETLDIIYHGIEYSVIYLDDKLNSQVSSVLHFEPNKRNIKFKFFESKLISISHTRKNFKIIDEL